MTLFVRTILGPASFPLGRSQTTSIPAPFPTKRRLLG